MCQSVLDTWVLLRTREDKERTLVQRAYYTHTPCFLRALGMRLGSLLGRAYITPPFFQKYRVLIVALVKFCLHGLHCPLDLAIGLSIQWRRCDMFEPPQSCKLFKSGCQ